MFLTNRKFAPNTSVQVTGNEYELMGRIAFYVFWVGVLILVHTLLMIWVEKIPFDDALWLSFTSISTVGYGDVHAKTNLGRACTVILLYMGGITLMAQILSEYVDYRIFRRERLRCGRWDWHMKNHIVILNSPIYNNEQYFKRIINQIKEHPDYQNTDIQILTTEFQEGLPASLCALGVRHFHGTPNNFSDLDHVGVRDAKHILVLAKNEYDVSVDSFTFDVVHRLKELGVVDRTFVECVDDDNRVRLHDLGARVVLRPIRSYPEIVVRSMVAPGSEAILEDFFTHDGDHPQRYSVELEGVRWSDIICALATNDMGVALGYVNDEDYVIPNPPAATLVTTTAIIVLVRETAEPRESEIRHCIDSYQAGRENTTGLRPAA